MRLSKTLVSWAVFGIGSFVFANADSLELSPLPMIEDCIGHYTFQVPGDVEYAVFDLVRLTSIILASPMRFYTAPSLGDLGVWGNKLVVDFGSSNPYDYSQLFISVQIVESSLEAMVRSHNAANQKFKDQRLKDAAEATDPYFQKEYLEEAAKVGFFEPFNGNTVYAVHDDEWLTLWTRIGGRLVKIARRRNGTPQQTIDTFLANYHARSPMEVPHEAGVCLPYAFMTGQNQPASIGVSMRIRSMPEIIVYMLDARPTTDGSDAAVRSFVSDEIHGGVFYANRITAPMDEGVERQYRQVKIDGHDGLGAFTIVTRHRDAENPVNNEGNNDNDWGYYAFAPGDRNAAKGTSSDVTVRIERFGRFAKQPMTEQEFREMVNTIVASIKRRPDAASPK